MFGYIRPMKPELKMSEYQAFNAVYCGFCRTLGKDGALLRMTLSYDFTFFSLLSLSLHEDFCGFETMRCPVKMFSKRPCVKASKDLEYSADLALIMLYAKLKDSIRDKDEGRLFSKIASLYVKPKYKRSKEKHPKEAQQIEDFISLQFETEEKGGSFDALCHPTAKLLSDFFSNLTTDEEQREALARFGYVLGRWVYILDAVDDLEKDIKKGSFNPFRPLVDEGKSISEIKKEAELSLNVCISDACDTFLKLKLYNFEPIIKNIIFLGLKNTQNAILHYTDKKERKRALNGKSL